LTPLLTAQNKHHKKEYDKQSQSENGTCHGCII
jgi:hypothetical protein